MSWRFQHGVNLAHGQFARSRRVVPPLVVVPTHEYAREESPIPQRSIGGPSLVHPQPFSRPLVGLVVPSPVLLVAKIGHRHDVLH